MKNITNMVKIHLKNNPFWLLVPWLIVLCSFIVNLLIAWMAGGKTAIYTGGLSSLFIFMLIIGATGLNETFPFALGFGIRRADYVLGTLVAIGMSSAVSTLLLLVFSLVESQVTRWWGVNLHFFSLPYINDGSLIGQLWIYFITIMHMYLLGFVVASIYRRFGRYGMYVFFAAGCLLLSAGVVISTYLHWWAGIYTGIAQHSAPELASWLALGAVGYALGAYLLLRRATV